MTTQAVCQCTSYGNCQVCRSILPSTFHHPVEEPLGPNWMDLLPSLLDLPPATDPDPDRIRRELADLKRLPDLGYSRTANPYLPQPLTLTIDTARFPLAMRRLSIRMAGTSPEALSAFLEVLADLDVEVHP